MFVVNWKCHKNRKPIYMLLYVDDMLLAYESMTEIARVKRLLNLEFEMKDLGHAKKILGMEITKNRKEKVLYLSQVDYLKRVLERFNLKGAKSITIPLAQHFKLSKEQEPKSDEDIAYMQKVPNASVVGSIMYFMVCCIPDISYSMSVVSRFMANPGKRHWETAKLVLRYISGTIDVGLKYVNRGDVPIIEGYVDSNFVGSNDTRKSTIGYAFKVFGNLVSWRANL